MKHKKFLKIPAKKLYINHDVTILRAKLTTALHRRPDVKYVDIFIEKVVLIIFNDKGQIFNILFELREWDMKLVDFVCNEFKHVR